MEKIEPITFEKMPQALSFLIEEVKALRSALTEKTIPVVEEDRWLNIDQLREYLPDYPAKATIYGWVSNRQIPFHKGNGGKKLRFLTSEIDQYLMAGRQKSIHELQVEASNYQRNHKKTDL